MNQNWKNLGLFAVAAGIAGAIIFLLHKLLPHEVESGPQLIIAIELAAVVILFVTYGINEVLEIWKKASEGPEQASREPDEGVAWKKFRLIFVVALTSYALYLAAIYI
jgi:hypothetical protein